MSLPDTLRPHLELCRLRAEAALVARLNAGYGFDAARIPARTYLRDPAARERLGRDAVRPEGTHEAQAAELAEAIEETESALELHQSALTELSDRFALSRAEAALLSLAVAYELDVDTRALCDALSGRRRVGLVAEVAGEIDPALADAGDLLDALHPGATLRRELLVGIAEESRGAMASAAVAATDRAVAWLLGDPRLPPDLVGLVSLIAAEDDPGVMLPEEAVGAIDRVAGRLRAADDEGGDPAPMVLVQGPQGAGKRGVAHQLARALRQPLAVAPIPDLLDAVKRGDRGAPRRALAEARLRGALPYLPGAQALDGDDARDAAPVIAAAIRGSRQVVALSTRERGMPSAPGGRPFHLIRLPRPDLPARRSAWSHGLEALGDAADVRDDAADSLAARYVVGPGTIAAVLREARAFSRATGEPVGMTGIEEAVGRRLTLRLGAFGTLISRRASFDQMVLPDDVIDTLRDMIAMVRERARILETWGYARHLGISRGVSALFSGDPGTGKTMAASVISSELGMELIRIDLSAVVSKWVGETEKHLAKIFDEAQNANAMLVFDEADSLFGKRTEVKTAQDRYANLEVNYVLQRMETFDGICILTSNLEASIDPAFLRRLNFRVRFPAPEAEERKLLWQRLLPPEVGVPDDSDLFDKLADTFEMTGGHIKNAIVRAAVIAAREDRRLEPKDLVAGAHLEYLELGKVMPSLT